ncbi:MAG: hypothetical protein H0T89_08660 [Deltaproteobacteria bacterium]|nr:hypothetical protein [Deltaproteobacteria bacterium]
MTASSDSGDDDELDDASLRAMRAVWVSMREEDPPAAGMAELLAAARANAEAMQPRASWWERFAGTMRRAPVLAFATVVLMAGGAVLVSRTQRDQPAVATTDDPSAEPTMTSPTVSRSAAVVGEPPPVETTTASPEVATPSVADGTDVANLRGERGGIEEEPAGAVKKPRRAASPPKPKAELVERAQKVPTESPTASTGGLAIDQPDTAADTPSSTKDAIVAPTKPAPKQPVAEPRPDADRGTVIVNESEQRKQTEAAPKAPSVQQLAQQAESAAARSDCPAVRVLVARIRKQDAAYYKQRLAINPAITRCL